MNTRILLLVAVAATLVCAMAPTAPACDGFGYGYGYLYDSLDYNVPYFAAHPPVYYSYPVPRTYGYSPFAYPPTVMTPEVVAEAKPLQIINPYVPSSEKSAPKADEDRTAAAPSQPEPLVIINPFVTPKQSVAQAEL